MKTTLALRTIAAAGLLVAGFAVNTTAFGADEEITVMGAKHPPVMRNWTGERSGTTGAPIEEVTTTRVIHYSDLDLTQRHDMRILDRRIMRAAREGCEQLGRLFPQLAYPGDAEKDHACVRDARFDAYSQLTANLQPPAPL